MNSSPNKTYGVIILVVCFFLLVLAVGKLFSSDVPKLSEAEETEELASSKFGINYAHALGGGYSQSGYYSQGGYYSQSNYYGQSSYYSQSNYYSQSQYFIYAQSSYVTVSPQTDRTISGGFGSNPGFVIPLW